MSSQTNRSITWELLEEQVNKFLGHTLAMKEARSRMDERTTCEDLELMSSCDATISSGGIGGGWDAGGRGAVVVVASIIWGLVVWDVGGAAVSQGTSRVVGVA